MTSLTADALFVVLSGDRSGHAADLARELAPALGLPLLARDTLRSALAGALEVDGDGEDRLTRACATALVALAADCGGGVLEGIGADDAALRGLDGTVVEVACRPDGAPGPSQAGWPVVEVDSSAPVDVDPLADEVVAAASRDGTAMAAGGQWVVWRQDAAGQRVEVTRRDSEAMARSVAAVMDATASEHTFVVTPAG